MVLMKRFKTFDDAIFEMHPDLKEFLKPNDNYPELERILKNRPLHLPPGSVNTKVIIKDGEVVQRVFNTPMGRVVSMFSNASNVFLDQVA